MRPKSPDWRLLKLKLEPYAGHKHFYPVNVVAKRFCGLLGQKCLSEEQVKEIKELGYKIEVAVVQPPKF
jgi:hypothetical protein